MSGTIRIAIVDDHPLFRAGVIQSLMLYNDIELVGEGSSRDEAVALARSAKPSIMLMDISMPGNGLAAIDAIATQPMAPKLVMLTVSEEDDDVMEALRLGAVGYILKGVGAPELIGAIRAVADGNCFIAPNLAVRLLSPKRTSSPEERIASLTEQERNVLALVATGLSNREVGDRLDILERTVKYHMTRIMDKLAVKNRVQATLVAKEAWRSSPVGK